MATLLRLCLGLRFPRGSLTTTTHTRTHTHKPTFSAKSFRLAVDTQSMDFFPQSMCLIQDDAE